MKKIFYILMVNILILLVTSCAPVRKSPFKEGTFYTNSDYYNSYYSGIKLEVKKISNQEFESRNGINVVEDILTKSKYSLSLLIYCNETGQMEETMIYDVKPWDGKSSPDYFGLMEFSNFGDGKSYNIVLGMSLDNTFFLRIDNDYESFYYNLFLESYIISDGIYYSSENFRNTFWKQKHIKPFLAGAFVNRRILVKFSGIRNKYIRFFPEKHDPRTAVPSGDALFYFVFFQVSPLG